MTTAVGSAASAPVAPTSSTTSSGAAAAAASEASSSLLPAPTELQGNPLSLLYLFQSENEQMGLSSGTAKLQGLETERHQALTKEQNAINTEAAAAKHKSFWDKLGSICAEIAKVASVVAAVAAAVATCGVGSPLAAVAVAGAALSTAGFLGSETHVLQKLGLSDKLAAILNTVMSAGGSIASLGSAAAAGAGSIISTTSAVVGGAGQAGSGASSIASGKALAAEDNAKADEVSAEGTQDGLTRMMSQVIQQVQNADDQTKQIMGTIAQTKGIENQTDLIAATGSGGTP